MRTTPREEHAEGVVHAFSEGDVDGPRELLIADVHVPGRLADLPRPCPGTLTGNLIATPAPENRSCLQPCKPCKGETT
jgi:hypothetical protein